MPKNTFTTNAVISQLLGWKGNIPIYGRIVERIEYRTGFEGHEVKITSISFSKEPVRFNFLPAIHHGPLPVKNWNYSSPIIVVSIIFSL